MSADPVTPKTEISFDNTAIAFSGASDVELRKSRWLFRLMGNPALVDIGAHFTKLAFKVGLPVKTLVKKTIYAHFCGGESLQETLPTVNRLSRFGVSTILDYGVEGKESEEEFARAMTEQLNAIKFADEQSTVPYISCKITAYARFELLTALNEGDDLSMQQLRELQALKDRLITICDAAVASDVAVYIDAEESWIQDGIDNLVEELMQVYNQKKATVFNTVQLYRHDRLEFLKNSHRKAQEEGYILAVKLVRGAYMEKERERAKRKGYPSPIQPNKEACDKDFDLAVEYCLNHVDRIAFCAATHNEYSCLVLAQQAIARGVDPTHPNIHFAQLYGMSDHISFNLAKIGFNASKYVPYGPVKDVIPYLIRRAEENSSVAGQMGRELLLIEEEIDRRGM